MVKSMTIKEQINACKTVEELMDFEDAMVFAGFSRSEASSAIAFAIDTIKWNEMVRVYCARNGLDYEEYGVGGIKNGL